jgi:hypothetical protein
LGSGKTFGMNGSGGEEEASKLGPWTKGKKERIISIIDIFSTLQN